MNAARRTIRASSSRHIQSGTAQGKKEALEAAGVKVGKTPSETAMLMREVLASL